MLLIFQAKDAVAQSIDQLQRRVPLIGSAVNGIFLGQGAQVGVLLGAGQHLESLPQQLRILGVIPMGNLLAEVKIQQVFFRIAIEHIAGISRLDMDGFSLCEDHKKYLPKKVFSIIAKTELLCNSGFYARETGILSGVVFMEFICYNV